MAKPLAPSCQAHPPSPGNPPGKAWRPNVYKKQMQNPGIPKLNGLRVQPSKPNVILALLSRSRGDYNRNQMDRSFSQLQQKVFALYEQKRFEDALKLAGEAISVFPHKAARLTYWQACFFCLLNQPEQALETLQNGLNQGLRWGPYPSHPGFRSGPYPRATRTPGHPGGIRQAPAELSSQHPAQAPGVPAGSPGSNYPFADGLPHQGFQPGRHRSPLASCGPAGGVAGRAAILAARWARRILLGRPRHSQPGRQPCSRSLADPIYSGFTGHRTGRGLPGSQPGGSAHPARGHPWPGLYCRRGGGGARGLAASRQPCGPARGVRGVFVTGEHDQARSHIEIVYRELKARGLECQLHVVPGLGHNYPSDMPELLAGALGFILGG